MTLHIMCNVTYNSACGYTISPKIVALCMMPSGIGIVEDIVAMPSLQTPSQENMIFFALFIISLFLLSAISRDVKEEMPRAAKDSPLEHGCCI